MLCAANSWCVYVCRKNGVNLILRLWIVASLDISLAVRADFIEDIFEHVSLVNFHRIATGNWFCIFGDQCIAKAIGGGTERKKKRPPSLRGKARPR